MAKEVALEVGSGEEVMAEAMEVDSVVAARAVGSVVGLGEVLGVVTVVEGSEEEDLAVGWVEAWAVDEVPCWEATVVVQAEVSVG